MAHQTKCPACGWDGLAYATLFTLEAVFECDECDSQYEIEADADYDGECYVDESQAGARVGDVTMRQAWRIFALRVDGFFRTVWWHVWIEPKFKRVRRRLANERKDR